MTTSALPRDDAAHVAGGLDVVTFATRLCERLRHGNGGEI